MSNQGTAAGAKTLPASQRDTLVPGTVLIPAVGCLKTHSPLEGVDWTMSLPGTPVTVTT